MNCILYAIKFILIFLSQSVNVTNAGDGALMFFFGGVGSSRIRIKSKLVDAVTGKEQVAFNNVRFFTSFLERW